MAVACSGREEWNGAWGCGAFIGVAHVSCLLAGSYVFAMSCHCLLRFPYFARACLVIEQDKFQASDSAYTYMFVLGAPNVQEI